MEIGSRRRYTGRPFLVKGLSLTRQPAPVVGRERDYRIASQARKPRSEMRSVFLDGREAHRLPRAHS